MVDVEETGFQVCGPALGRKIDALPVRRVEADNPRETSPFHGPVTGQQSDLGEQACVPFGYGFAQKGGVRASLVPECQREGEEASESVAVGALMGTHERGA
jgi:hypothetical protein